MFGRQPLKHLHLVERHLALVKTHPCQHFAVSTEIEDAAAGKFLLIDPIRDAIKHIVEFSVSGYLALAVVEQ